MYVILILTYLLRFLKFSVNLGFFVLTWDIWDQELGNLQKGEWKHCSYTASKMMETPRSKSDGKRKEGTTQRTFS